MDRRGIAGGQRPAGDEAGKGRARDHAENRLAAPGKGRPAPGDQGGKAQDQRKRRQQRACQQGRKSGELGDQVVAGQGQPGAERWLVTSARHTAYSGMLPGWLAGHYRADELMIDLLPLAQAAGARLVLDDVAGLDAGAGILALASGGTVGFDLLSLATGGETEVAGLAMLGERLLPVRPVGAFMRRWSAFVEAAGPGSTVRVAIAGGGAAGVELALGVHAALRGAGVHGGIALVSAAGRLLAGHHPRVRARVLAELERRGIAVHHATATGTADGLLLSDGRRLAADCVIAATGSRAPGWLARSGLACNAAGFVRVGADLRSLSHAGVFAAGDIIDRADRGVARSGVHAVRAGPVLAANLRAALDGTDLRTCRPRRRTLYLLATGDRRAILSWGGLVAAGRWVWRLKDRIDRAFVARYTRKGAAGR